MKYSVGSRENEIILSWLGRADGLNCVFSNHKFCTGARASITSELPFS